MVSIENYFLMTQPPSKMAAINQHSFCVACVAGSTHRDHFVRRLASSCVVPRRPASCVVLRCPTFTLSATPPKWLNRFQWNFPKFFYTYCRCAPPILFLGFKIFCQILVIFGLCQTSWKGGGGWALSATPPKWLNRFQWNFPKFFYTYCRCAPPILFLGF